jgi:hypothetical protein
VITNSVYPEDDGTVHISEPVLGQVNVSENGEHVELERTRPFGLARRFEQ